MEIKLLDTNFAHAISCSNGDLKIYPQHFKWYRGPENRDVAVFVDNEFRKVRTVQSRIKIWMLLEPQSVIGYLYDVAKQPDIQQEFDYILTFSKELCAISPKFVYYPLGGCWIEPQDRQVYPKTKHISIIASEKNYTEGHKLRHELVNKYGGQIDVFGRGYNFIPYKLTALKDYRYSIIIENGSYDGYFSEKLIDSFVTGTIPIYWGDPSIFKTFPGYGIIPVKYIDRFLDPVYGKNVYDATIDHVEHNFNTAQQFVNTEDWLWNNFFKNICTTTQQK